MSLCALESSSPFIAVGESETPTPTKSVHDMKTGGTWAICSSLHTALQNLDQPHGSPFQGL